MSGRTSGVGEFILMVGFGHPAKAQGIVPGGWAPRPGEQALGAPGFALGVTPSGSVGLDHDGPGLYLRQATWRHRGR
jgi:hypothetical protein